MYENVTCRRGEVLFYNKLNGYSCYPYMLKIYNLKNKTWRTVGDDIKIDFPIRSRGLQMVNSKRVWFNAPLDYKLYCFEDDTPAAHYQLDISMAKLSDDLIKKSISDPQTFFNEVSMGKIVYSLNSLRETENFLIFHSNQTGLFLFDKKENKLYVDEFLWMTFFTLILAIIIHTRGMIIVLCFCLLPIGGLIIQSLCLVCPLSGEIRQML